jgi:predicted flap endonuclease-1-like 5' DNA nuclease
VAWFLGQSFVVILLAFLLGLLVGWLWWGRPWHAAAARQATSVAVAHEPSAPAQPEPEPAPIPEPEPEPALTAPVADDLERIEGIGPRMAAALNRAGITTYRELAASDEPRLRAAIEAAGLKFAPSLVTWARQARLLADGDEAGFADLTRRLVAGRDTGRP